MRFWNSLLFPTALCAGVVLAFLSVFPPDPFCFYEKIEWIPPTEEQDAPKTGEGFRRTAEYFDSRSDNVKLHGWLYLPTDGHEGGSSLPPVVLMASGFGAQKDTGLEGYAEAFAKEGFAALAFDYRYWGGSGGYPRLVSHPPSLVEDWMSAVDHVIDSGGFGGKVDQSRIALCGNSYAGGHVVVAAAKLQQKKNAARYSGVRCLVSQVPYLRPESNSVSKLIRRRGLGFSLRLIMSIMADATREFVNREGLLPPLYVKIATRKSTGEPAAMALDDEDFKFWENKILHKTLLGGWKNLVAARSLAYTNDYNPIQYAGNITIPIFFIAAEFDSICPPKDVQDAAAIINAKVPAGSPPLAKIYVHPATHFQLYHGENFVLILAKMIDFLKTSLVEN